MALSGRTDIRHTFVAGADLSDYLHRLGTLNGSGELVPATAGDRAMIIVEEVDAAGKSASVLLHGKGKVTLGGTVAALAPLTSNATANAVAATTAADEVFAVALEAGAAGDVVEVFTVYDITNA